MGITTGSSFPIRTLRVGAGGVVLAPSRSTRPAVVIATELAVAVTTTTMEAMIDVTKPVPTSFSNATSAEGEFVSALQVSSAIRRAFPDRELGLLEFRAVFHG